jgi:hypothetical protein
MPLMMTISSLDDYISGLATKPIEVQIPQGLEYNLPDPILEYKLVPILNSIQQ